MTKLEEIAETIENFSRNNMTDDILHGWPHVNRVIKYAKMINDEINGNWEIIKTAILFHDVGYKIKRENHNVLSAEMAEKFLLSENIDIKTIEHVKNCILTHSRQFAKEKPSTDEAKVVFDADGMDLYGPIGLMRALLSCALRNLEFDCMLKKISWRISEIDNFYSNIAKNFVLKNSKIIKKYNNELIEQINLLNK